MKTTNKEYPATHSMETSWFAIDEDGFVAVLRCEENGPVPKCAEQDSDIDCEAGEYYFSIFDDDENVKSTSPVQVYVYEGTLDSDKPMKRIFVPYFLMKENEFSEEVREKSIRLPIRFKDTEYLQIAEYTPCNVYLDDDHLVEIDGYYYALLKTVDGNEAYFNLGKPQKKDVEEVNEYLKNHPRELPKEVIIDGKKFYRKTNYERVSDIISRPVPPYFFQDNSGKVTLSAKEVTDILYPRKNTLKHD